MNRIPTLECFYLSKSHCVFRFECIAMLTIPDFFKAKNIFITGGTGFIGKALVEKLLRSCPDVGTIYVLVRKKKGKDVRDRIEDMLKNEVFCVVREKNPSALNKVVGIAGDIEEIGLGLSKEDEHLLASQLDFIYNCAATVRFDTPFKEAVIINVRSAREVCRLALKCKHLKCVLHTSTTYCNLNLDNVDEKVYPPLLDWKDTIEIVEDVSRDPRELDILTQKIIEPFANTYTFTKKMSEQVFVDMCMDKLPLVILRPSIVIGSLREPICGWIDNLNGPFVLVIVVLAGLANCIYSPNQKDLNIVFVDNVAKAMISTTWQKSLQSNNLNDVHVYNVCADMHWGLEDFHHAKNTVEWTLPMERKLRFVADRSFMFTCWYYYYFYIVVFNIIPWMFGDVLLRIGGKKPILLKLGRKVYLGNQALIYFMAREFHFGNSNYKLLDHALLDSDKEDFSTLTSIPRTAKDRADMGQQIIAGIKRYVLKETFPIQPQTYRNAKRVYVMSMLVNYLFYGLLIYVVWNSGIIPNLIDKSYSYIGNVGE